MRATPRGSIEARPERQVERRAAISNDRQRRQRIERQAKADSNRAPGAGSASSSGARGRSRIAAASLRSARSPASASPTSVSSRTIGAAERLATQQLRQQNRQAERLSRAQQRAIQPRLDDRQALDIRQQQNWTAYANRFATVDDDRRERFVERPLARSGRGSTRTGMTIMCRCAISTTYYDTPDYYYRYDYDDGYLYRVDRDDNFVMALIPLLGGAYSVGQPLPFYYQSGYNVPLGYRSLYYDTPDYYYRYGDGAIYQVDPATQLIQGIVALLTGQSLGIGQRLPLGYDVYNVPYAYRSNYFDTTTCGTAMTTATSMGSIRDTRLIETMIPAYDGYAVGYPAPLGYRGL